MGNLKFAWIEYKKRYLPKAEPAVEAELRKVFFCGALAYFEVLNEAAKLQPESMAVAAVNALDVEIFAFRDSLLVRPPKVIASESNTDANPPAAEGQKVEPPTSPVC